MSGLQINMALSLEQLAEMLEANTLSDDDLQQSDYTLKEIYDHIFIKTKATINNADYIDFSCKPTKHHIPIPTDDDLPF